MNKFGISLLVVALLSIVAAVNAAPDDCRVSFEKSNLIPAAGGVLDQEIVEPSSQKNVTLKLAIIPRGAELPKVITAVAQSVKGGPVLVFEINPTTLLYEKELAPGRYLLTVSGKNPSLQAPSRFITVRSSDAVFEDPIKFYLAASPVPYFRMGNALVPFAFANDLMAVTFPFNPPFRSDAQQLAADAKKELLPVEPAKKNDLPPHLSFVNAHDAVWLYKLEDSSRREEITEKFEMLLDYPARIGIPIDLPGSNLHVLDNHFVVRVRDSVPVEVAEDWLASVKATKLRQFPTDARLWQIKFESGSHCEQLIQLESKLSSVFIAAEPDLLIEMRSAANLPAGWPDDSRYQKQDASGKGNFPHQKIGRAWNLIHNNRGGSNTQIKIGHPGIYVASLDEGINPGAQEVKCNAEDATAVVPKLGCYDVRDSLYCDDPRYDKPTRPEEAHGMAVFGLISACTNNNKKQIAGIAPGSHHIAIKRPLYTSTVDYGNVLLWLGGFPPQPCPIGTACSVFPKLDMMPQIINASHGFATDPNDPTSPAFPVPLPAWIDSAFNALVTQGRGGKGVVLVYAAGNSDRRVEDYEPLAADPRTLGISNCWVSPTGLESRAPAQPNAGKSNYGSAIDICALGFASETIDPWCDSSGNCVFGGTSGAAATVSGAIALLLSVNPNLTWTQIRTLLTDAAKKIDDPAIDALCTWTLGRSLCYGKGLLDVCESVRSVLNLPLNACN